MRERLKNVGLSILSLLITLLLVELLLQSFPLLLPAKHTYLAHRICVQNLGDLKEWLHKNEVQNNVTLFRQDSILGWSGVPNCKGTNWSTDGVFDVSTNCQGFRDVDRETVRQHKKTRIAVVGDSFIWGHNLNQKDLMPQLLEGQLTEMGYAVEVLNLGIGGFGNDQEYLMLHEYVLPCQPDIVLLSFFYSNDFWNNHEEVSSRKAKPYFQLREDGMLELQPMTIKHPIQNMNARTEQAKQPARSFREMLEKRSLTYNLLIRNEILRNVAYRFGLATPANPLDLHENEQLFDYQKKLTKAILSRFKQDVEASGAKFMVFFYPGYGYYYGDQAKYLETLKFFRENFSELEWLDLTPEFDRQKEPMYFFYSEHWNSKGSKLAAEVLARNLDKRCESFSLVRRKGLKE